MVTALSELAGLRRTFTSNHELTAHWHIPHQIDYFLIDYIGWYRASRIMIQIFLTALSVLSRQIGVRLVVLTKERISIRLKHFSFRPRSLRFLSLSLKNLAKFYNFKRRKHGDSKKKKKTYVGNAKCTPVHPSSLETQ